MAKGGESKTEGAQVNSEEVHIKDNNDHTSHIHKRMVRGNEASMGEITTRNRGSFSHEKYTQMTMFGGHDMCHGRFQPV